ncbi:MAG: L-lactate dehydrogenase (quinone) large subunit LdhH [Armatimonadota bacterium]
MTDPKFKKQVSRAVKNKSLKTALDRAATAYDKARPIAFEDIDFEACRSNLRACKESSLQDIGALFEKFKREAEMVGVKVHQAADADEANRIVLELTKTYGAKKIVKSKSMLSEEIELNRNLEASGLMVTETDLGEWICQLAGERPSHFTAPAIHKTREEIAELFTKATGREAKADIPELVGIARREMRQAFIEADMGISGANIAIAETGTLVIVSNEGNARLVTSLPEVHVALVGYEKLVPSIDEAVAVIKLLSKSATAQKMTSYVSFITGPSRTSDIEKTLTLGCHGPKELHIIFVDNGRLAMLDDPDFREALCCVKCGACLAVCPVYRSVGGHVFGHTYVGGIGAILAAFHAGLDQAEDIINICASCRRCTSYCPSKISVPDMILKLRSRLTDAHGQPWMQKFILKYLLGNPERLNSAVSLGKRFQPLLDIVKPLPVPMLAGLKNAPSLADKPLRERLPDLSPAHGTKRGTVALFPGCAIDYVYPEIGESAAKVLTGMGWEVRYPKGQGCCGVPALTKGDADTARSLACHNVNIPEFQSSDYIITACPTCAMALKHEFIRLLGPDSPDAEAASVVAGKVRDFSEFLVNVIGVTADNFEGGASGQMVTYHDPCHARHGLGIIEEPRELLKLAGYEITELPDPGSCCGFAGTFSLTFPEVSESVYRRKYESIKATGASIVATDCPGCLIQLRGRLHESDSEIKVLHTAEIINNRSKS